MEYLVEMKGITKRFPRVLANDRVDFNVRPGEIHALLGENGSGKSTLMSILAGLYRPDDGQIIYKGRPVSFRSPRDAIRAGIGMVHQHFKLVETFTVAENIILGDRNISFVLRPAAKERELTELSARFGLAINPGAYVWQLSVGERQRVEIVKMLYRGCQLLILDEPTAVLTPQESAELFANLRRMADDGRGVVMITHKLSEVMAVADRVTVLRGGRAVAAMTRGSFSERELATAMVGREVTQESRRQGSAEGRTVLEMRDVYALNDVGRWGLEGVSLAIRSGEILGVAGVAGNGQRELAEVITGLRPVQRGRIFLEGQDVTNLGPQALIDRGISHIPEDRLGTGLAPGMNAIDNILLKDYRKAKGRAGLIDYKAARSRTQKLVQAFDVRLAGLRAPVKLLSGGNLQKLLLARELSAEPRLIVAAYPARGLDIAAAEAVSRFLLQERRRGTAILLISEDLDEIFALSDRIIVLSGGRVMGEPLRTETATREQVGLLMMGAGGEAKAV